MTDCGFTYSHYEYILDLIQKAEYKVVFFNESCPDDKELIIRHDIDLDLDKAYRMAQIENKHKVKATYFIMVRSPFYNILDRSNSDFIRGISDLGHQIGLHFDEAYYGSNDTENVIKYVNSEVQILKEHFDTGIFAVSFHRPSQFLLQSDIKLKNGLVNTYDRNFINKFKYISDSRRMWKDGCLCTYFDKTRTDCPRIQALVHPIWWTDKIISAQAAMDRFLFDKLKYLDSELGKNIQIYNRLF